MRLYFANNLRKENLFLHLLLLRRCCLIVSVFHLLSNSLSLTDSDKSWVHHLHIFIFDYPLRLLNKLALCIFLSDPSCVSLTGNVQQKNVERTCGSMTHIRSGWLHHHLHNFSRRLHTEHLHFTHERLKLKLSQLEDRLLDLIIIIFEVSALIVMNLVRLGLALHLILALK